MKAKDGLATMKEIRAWAAQPLPDCDSTRAEITIDKYKAKIADPYRYRVWYHFVPDDDGVPWMKSCDLNQRGVRHVCTELMKLEGGPQ